MENNRKNNNTDNEETVFFSAAKSGKSTDRFDTQELPVEEIRRQAQRENYGYTNRNNGAYYNSTQEGEVYRGAPGQPLQTGESNYAFSASYQSGNSYGGQNQPGYSNQSTAGPRNYSGQSQHGYSSQSTAGPRTYSGQSRPGYSGQSTTRPRNYSGQSQPRSTGRQTESSYDRRSAPTRQEHASQRRTQEPVPPRRRQEPPRKEHALKRRKKSGFGKILKWILYIIIIIFLLYSLVALVGIFSMNRVDTSERSYTDGSLSSGSVKNVLVIGTDSRDPETDRGRSDSMILVSFNSNTHDLYMTSFMRDAYVEIPGNGSGKLNAAYSYGGAELLMDTIEYNYDVDINDYVMVTFEACADMIDAVGGVKVELSDSEAEAVNEILISEVNEIMGDDREDDLLDGGGTVKLDGKQALSYSRIRYVGNADFERTERQRTVLTAVAKKVMVNPFRLFSICTKALPDMTTNMSVGKLYGYAITSPIKLLYYDMEQLRIPDDTMYSNATINGESVLQVDFQTAIAKLKQTVFAD